MSDLRQRWWILVYYYVFGLSAACPLRCDCFTDNRGIATVDCQNISLTSIPSGIPANCNILLLRDNNLSKLPAYSFENITQLLLLDVSGNDIKFIDVNAFLGLSKLKTLRLNRNNIPYNKSGLIPGVFRPLIYVTSLFIGLNANVTDRRQEYPDEAIGDMLNLEHLGMDGLTNKTFGPGFKCLRNLRVLDMSGNSQRCKIDTLDNRTLESFRSTPLTEIYFQNCVISRISSEAFAGIVSLALLDLSYSKRQLPFDQLEDLSFGLKTTNISYLYLNKLSNFDTHNVLDKRHLRFLKHTKLKELQLDDNDITWIETDWVRDALPRTLEKLSLKNNFLLGDSAALTYTIFFLPNLKEFQLSPIHSVNVGTMLLWLPFNLEALVLTSINTDGVPLPSITFTGNSLQRIILTRGSVSGLRGPMVGLNVLEKMELSHLNCFHITFDYFQFMPLLKSINLSTNYLGLTLSHDEKGTLFENQRMLVDVDLSRNSIASLPARFFQGLRQIQFIDLSYNAIRDLNVHLDKMPFLNTLNLFSNQLLYLPSHVIKSLDIIAKKTNISVDLGDNPLTCDCSSYSFLTWMSTTQVHFVKKDNYTCIMDGVIVYFGNMQPVLFELDQLCASRTILLGLCSCCISLSLIFCFGGILYRYRLHITYLYHAAWRQHNTHRTDVAEEFTFTAF